MLRIGRKIDFNTILQFLNLLILTLSVIWFYTTEENPYVDIRVLAATFFLHLQLSYFLWYEKKRTNPFIMILVIVTLFFYMLRIFTLLADEYRVSLTFTREGGDAIGSNAIFEFLVYLFFSLWAIFFGLKHGDKKNANKSQSQGSPVNRQKYLTLIYLSVFSVIYFLGASFLINTDSGAGLVVGLLSGLFNYEIFVMLLTIMAFYYKDHVPKIYSRTALVLVLLFFFFKIINGGSGPMIRIGFPFIFTLLMIKGRISVKLSLLIVTLLLVASTSIFGTFIKFSNQKINMDLIRNFKTLDEDQYRFIFSQIAARAAFLDFSVELINNKEYGRIINIPRYMKSLTDAYTPGFDVFDEPLTGHALRAVYQPSFPSKPTRKDVVEDYQSDQINVFSEYYVLFGPILSLPFLFIFALVFKKLYNYSVFIVHNKIIGLLIGAISLNLFWIWLRTFGMDFMIADFPNTVLPVLFIYFSSRLTIGNFKLSVNPNLVKENKNLLVNNSV